MKKLRLHSINSFLNLNCLYLLVIFSWLLKSDKVHRVIIIFTEINHVNEIIGEFGLVYRSYLTGWQGRTTAEIVAVKTLKSTHIHQTCSSVSLCCSKKKLTRQHGVFLNLYDHFL